MSWVGIDGLSGDTASCKIFSHGHARQVEAIAEKGGAVEALNEDRSLKLNRVKAVEGERENLEGYVTVNNKGRTRRKLSWLCG